MGFHPSKLLFFLLFVILGVLHAKEVKAEISYEDDEDYYYDDDYVITEDDEAEARIDAMKAGMGTNPAEVREKALEFAMAGNMESAYAYFLRATELAPHDAGYWSDLGVTQMRIGALDEAKQSFHKSRDITPSKLVEDNLKALQEHLDWRDHGKSPERASDESQGGAQEEEEEEEYIDDEYDGDVDENGEVHLNSDNYSRLVETSSDVWLVEYYSGKCGSCKEFLPTWHDVSDIFADKLRRARVNIDDKAGMALAQSQGILNHGIPAVRLVSGAAGAELVMGGSKLLDAPSLTRKITVALTKFSPRDL
jgi:tetratricopeptide (TPR) repeat protein